MSPLPSACAQASTRRLVVGVTLPRSSSVRVSALCRTGAEDRLIGVSAMNEDYVWAQLAVAFWIDRIQGAIAKEYMRRALELRG